MKRMRKAPVNHSASSRLAFAFEVKAFDRAGVIGPGAGGRPAWKCSAMVDPAVGPGRQADQAPSSGRKGHGAAGGHPGRGGEVDEHQPMPGTGSTARCRGRSASPRVPALLPARAQLGDELSQHFAGQSGHPAIGNRGGTGWAA